MIKDIALTSFWGLFMGFGLALAISMVKSVGESRIENRRKEHPGEYLSISSSDGWIEGYKSFVGLLAIAIHIAIGHLISSNPFEFNRWALIPSVVVGLIAGLIVFVSTPGKAFASGLGEFIQMIWEFIAVSYLPPTEIFRTTSEKYKKLVAERRLEFLNSVQTLKPPEKDAIRDIVQETVRVFVVPIRTRDALQGWVNFLSFSIGVVVIRWPDHFLPVESVERGLLNQLIFIGLFAGGLLVIYGPMYILKVIAGNLSNRLFLLLFLVWPAVVIAGSLTFFPEFLLAGQLISWMPSDVLMEGIYVSSTVYVISVCRVVFLSFISFAHDRYIHMHFPQAVAIRSLLNLLSQTEKPNEAWSSISTKRNLIGQIEDAARCIETYLPKRLRTDDSMVDSQFQRVTRRFAGRLRDLKWFILVPSDEDGVKLARYVADGLIHTVNGTWQQGEDSWVLSPGFNSQREGMLEATRNWRQVITSIGLKIIIAVLPLSALLGVEAMVTLTVPILWMGLAILWGLVVILKAIDPRFDEHLSTFRRAAESIRPHKGAEEENVANLQNSKGE